MKLAVFATHPIQYQVPLWKELSDTPGWEVNVFYFSEQGLGVGLDPGFGRRISWDIPLDEGYKHAFIQRRPVSEAPDFFIPDFTSFLEDHKFDVALIHGYTHRFARQLIKAKSKYGYKVVLRGEFTDMPRRRWNYKRILKDIYLRWFYSHVDQFCPIGVDAVEHLQRFGIKQGNTTLAPYSVDNKLIENTRNSLDKRTCRADLDIPEGACVFLFSGKIISRKQPLLLAAALATLYPNYPNMFAIFLGSGEQEGRLNRLLGRKLQGAFLAPGFVNQSDLGKYFMSADIFVLPSEYDTWGLVVNEAMHYGLPCIVSEFVGSHRDLVDPGITGFTFDRGNQSALASHLRYFLDNPDMIQPMGNNALARIDGYTVEKTVEGLKLAISKCSNKSVEE